VTIQEIVKDIALYAEYYAKYGFFSMRKMPISSRPMHDINTLKVDGRLSFLPGIYDDYKQGKLAKADFVQYLRLIESYVFRRAICSIPPIALNKVIYNAWWQTLKKGQYLESIQAALYAKSGSGRFPHDDEFRAAFVAKDVYTSPRRNYLLGKLENYERKEPIQVSGHTIERVMPQTVISQKPGSKSWDQNGKISKHGISIPSAISHLLTITHNSLIIHSMRRGTLKVASTRVRCT